MSLTTSCCSRLSSTSTLGSFSIGQMWSCLGGHGNSSNETPAGMRPARAAAQKREPAPTPWAAGGRENKQTTSSGLGEAANRVGDGPCEELFLGFEDQGPR